jgi:deoxycytidine triphosphate deaminase
MGILTRGEILSLINIGEIKIEPFSPGNVKDASIELTLSDTFGRLKERHHPVNSLEAELPGKNMVEWVKVVDSQYMLAPHSSVIGKTKERITLSENIAGWLTGRGKVTLLGLNIHISSGFIQPNTNEEELFFVITNLGTASVSLYPDSKICQLILFKLLE